MLDSTRARECVRSFNFAKLFIEELGWDRHTNRLDVPIDGQAFILTAVAEKKGMVVFGCEPQADGQIPDHATRRKIERQVSKSVHEHIILYIDKDKTRQIWQWVKREPGKPTACREHAYHRSQPGDALIQKLQGIAFSLAEEETLTIVDVARRTRKAFDVERVTKRFYDEFRKQHTAFLKFITGIPVKEDQEWYASVMLNRLMFIYFIQRKGFLDGHHAYLRNRLIRTKQEFGKNKFYSFYRYFLLRLFHKGLGGRERTPELEKLLGRIPYLNGGLFDIHELERPDRYGKAIQIPDEAFEAIFDYFDGWQWHLDERPLRADNEINPGVLGYIFEKYINQKQMGAYYTEEDITEYISKNTVIPFLFDAARAKCRIAFDNPNGPTIWDLLKADPERYIYPSLLHGRDKPLPANIAAGLDDISQRASWNKPAPTEFALPTESWREVVARRKRCEELLAKLADGDVRDINELITLNLNIRQFAQDVIENCEGPELLRAFWHAIERVTILDTTAGSGAFLFAALNVLEPLYEACLDRMEAFVDELDRSGEKYRPEKFSDFRKVLEGVAAHPNRRYFIFKSIILNNLFGVDIMEEAVEICKLRLFLKLAAQVEPDAAKDNFGIEPLPDIDFNIRAGNTLVGYTTQTELERVAASDLLLKEEVKEVLEVTGDAASLYQCFLKAQTESDQSPAEFKRHLKEKFAEVRLKCDAFLAETYELGLAKKPKKLLEWTTSHQPFHWFVEFYDIMSNGGFDVIIGNPPYLEYSKVKSYKIRNYSTENCSNLYVFTVERSFVLSSAKGRSGMIIPISAACSGAMQPLRDHLTQTSRSFWLSHFSNRPGQLFTGAQNRLTIFVASGKQADPRQFSTRYHRWDARNDERQNLFPTLRYQALANDGSMFRGLLPKLGSPEAANALQRIRSKKTVDFFASRHGKHKVFWVRVPGYFCQFLLEPPMARPENGGPPRVRGEVNSIGFDDKLDCRVVHSVLNSSTYYQFFCTYTDTRHINPSDVAEFPLDLTTLANETKTRLTVLSAMLAKCFASHTTHWRKSGLLIDSIDSKPCKPIIDEIDRVLAAHYGFTEEELDFIINYDIKYRIGREAELDDE
jgi:Eco57I restriction-modification methylase